MEKERDNGVTTQVVRYTQRMGIPQTAIPAPMERDRFTDPRCRADWRGIWLALQDRTWSSVAVVAADEGIPTLPVAELVRNIGAKNTQQQIGLADLRFVQPAHMNAYLDVVQFHVRHGEHVVMALGSCVDNPATIPLARSADVAILCVSLGATKGSRLVETVEAIGRERFLGSVLVSTFDPGQFVIPKTIL